MSFENAIVECDSRLLLKPDQVDLIYLKCDLKFNREIERQLQTQFLSSRSDDVPRSDFCQDLGEALRPGSGLDPVGGRLSRDRDYPGHAPSPDVQQSRRL